MRDSIDLTSFVYCLRHDLEINYMHAFGINDIKSKRNHRTKQIRENGKIQAKCNLKALLSD